MKIGDGILAMQVEPGEVGVGFVGAVMAAIVADKSAQTVSAVFRTRFLEFGQV